MRIPKKSQYPTKIKVNKAIYTVVFVDNIEGGLSTLGLCDPNTKVIFIRNKLKPKDTLKVFIHEVLHALEFEFELKIEHNLIYNLMDPLFLLFYDNLKGDLFKS